MEWSRWWLFVVTVVSIAAVPGPAVILVASQALSGSWRSAAWTGVGVLTCVVAYYLITASGLSTWLLASDEILTGIRWVGAVYLCGLGMKLLAGAGTVACHESVREIPAQRLSRFWAGFAVEASNPQAILFFTALIPQFLDPHRPFLPQILMMAATDLVQFSMILSLYVYLAVRLGHLNTAPRFVATLNRMGGVMLIAVGVNTCGVRLNL